MRTATGIKKSAAASKPTPSVKVRVSGASPKRDLAGPTRLKLMLASAAIKPTLAEPSELAAQPVHSPDPVSEHMWEVYRALPTVEHRNQLVEYYKPLADKTVRRFAVRLPRRVDRGDLDTAANLGLMSAIGGFDPERGVRFESYCERRIRGALLDELRSQDWLPRPWRQRVERRKRVLEALRARSNRKPRDEEVARAMGMTLEVYSQVFGVGLPGAPSGASLTADPNGEFFDGLDVVPDMRHAAPGEKLTREELFLLVAERLSAKEARIIFLKYWRELPMREIGEMTGLSESRVCKIHAKLIGRLRDRFLSES